MFEISHLFFPKNICVWLSSIRLDLKFEVLRSLSSLLSIFKNILFLIHDISASDSCDNDNNCRQSNWHYDYERIFFFVKMNHLWSSINHYGLVLINSIRLILNLNGHVVVVRRLLDLDVKVWVEFVRSSDVVLHIFAVYQSHWLISTTAGSVISFRYY